MAETVRFDIAAETAAASAGARFMRLFSMIAFTAIGAFGIVSGLVQPPPGGFHNWVKWALIGGGALFLFIAAFASWLYSVPLPDAIEILPDGYRLSRGGRVLKSVTWSEPRVGFTIVDHRTDPLFVERARQDPAVLRLSQYFRPGGPLRPGNLGFNIPPVVGERLLHSARSHGLPVRSEQMMSGSQFGASLRIQVGTP